MAARRARGRPAPAGEPVRGLAPRDSFIADWVVWARLLLRALERAASHRRSGAPRVRRPTAVMLVGSAWSVERVEVA